VNPSPFNVRLRPTTVAKILFLDPAEPPLVATLLSTLRQGIVTSTICGHCDRAFLPRRSPLAFLSSHSAASHAERPTAESQTLKPATGYRIRTPR
jgi:hypothetical protein|tara:strand:+ start:7019 stop:7303 length:285 start_codon:yes stop_codon:yes gene_type:complete